MSDKELAKKMTEETELEYFLDAYKYATGQPLELVNRHEKPDFICRKRSTGILLGIELTWVMKNPVDAQWDAIIKERDEMSPYDIVDMLFSLLEKKGITRAKNYGKWANKCILVFQIRECPISEIIPYIVKEDYASHGFTELWIADYSTLEAYGAIELFGLSPQIWGYHKNPACGGKRSQSAILTQNGRGVVSKIPGVIPGTTFLSRFLPGTANLICSDYSRFCKAIAS